MDFSVFYQHQLITQGSLLDVVKQVKKLDLACDPLVIESESCKIREVDWRGTEQDVIKRLENTELPPTGNPARRGRPRLGVVAREVTLLPRHWEWLSQQPGGASVVLRRLVETASRQRTPEQKINSLQDSLNRFLITLAGDLPHLEEVMRSLYRGDFAGFQRHMSGWPDDIKVFALKKFIAITAIPKAFEI